MTSKFVDVWYGDILLAKEDEPYSDEYYCSYLNTQEREKADTFTQQLLQKKFIKTRARLKRILAVYLQIDPQTLVLEHTEYGKPYIKQDCDIYFNLSHKENKFVIAVSNIDELGIDIELCKDRKNMSGIVKKCFSEIESNFWSSLAVGQQTYMFYWFWVRKEAFVKAVGRGIALGLNQCVVDSNKQSGFISIPLAYGQPEDWSIIDVKLNDEDICAVVLKTTDKFEFKLIPFSKINDITQWQ
ncbi:MAG: 4'-phosphopantetheinyl transferase superfamily protein [Methylococcales symbiont of Hymedesmia sp. n. MRB-2018]|nr:MAG: 4'-phosphopantetheinyl transferase superfamily protein [Methylococcales symbiont of Hymedesmia sp. n. MRB-2018]